MKRIFLILTLVLISTSLVNCNKNELESQDFQGINPEGTWGIVALTYVTPGGTQNAYADEIKNGQAVNDFFFMKDGKFKQTSDMSGSGTMDTYEGTWKITGTKLIINLLMNGIHVELAYACELKSDLLILTITSPDYSLSIVNTFRRK